MPLPLPLNAPVHAVMIDLDGTLVDTLGDFEAVLLTVLRELGLPPVSRTFIEHTIGKGSEHLIRSLLTEVGAAERFDEAWPRYEAHYQTLNGRHARLYPGVLEGLQALQARGMPLACLTNKPTAFALPLLEQKGLMPFFRHVFGGDAFERKKPDPLPLLRTCEALGSLPAHTLMVGDSSNDARAARSAGCPVVLMDYGYNHGEPVAAVDSDGTFSRLDTLVQGL